MHPMEYQFSENQEGKFATTTTHYVFMGARDPCPIHTSNYLADRYLRQGQ